MLKLNEQIPVGDTYIGINPTTNKEVIVKHFMGGYKTIEPTHDGWVEIVIWDEKGNSIDERYERWE